ncbi:hypothetical protein LCGC14_2838320, partial [marine sediment metagenome]
FWLVTLLMETTVLRETRLAERSQAFAFLAAAIYAAHPVQTEAVTYIFQRHAILVGLLYMLSIALYLHWRQTGKLLWYALCLAAAVLAMKSKANAFTLPVMIVATEFMFFGGFKKSGDFKKRVLPLVPILLTMLIVPLTLASLHSGAEPGQAASVAETIGKYAAPTKENASYLITQFRVIPTYLRLLLLPVGQNLDYDYPEYDTLASAPVVLSLMLLTALGLAGVFCFRAGLKAGIKGKRELLLVSWGVLWFFVTLSIESSFVRIPMVINEYRLYLPSAGIITAAVALAFVVMEGWPSIKKFRPETVVLGLVIVMLLTRYPMKTVATAPTRAQLFDNLYAEVVTWFGKVPTGLQSLYTVKTDRIEFTPKPKDSFFSARTAKAEQPEALQGIHRDDGFVLIL